TNLMQYAFLIYVNQADYAKMPETQQAAIMQGYNEFTEDVMKRNILKGGEPLESVTTATTVRIRDGKTLTTDGPFAETKEQLAGFYVFECKDLDEAIQWAAKIPGAKQGAIEIRPEIAM